MTVTPAARNGAGTKVVTGTRRLVVRSVLARAGTLRGAAVRTGEGRVARTDRRRSRGKRRFSVRYIYILYIYIPEYVYIVLLLCILF